VTQKLQVSLKIILSLILLGYIFFTVDIKSVIQILSSVNLNYFFIAILFVILNYIFSSLRWLYLILENNKPSFFYLLKLYFVGAFFNNFLPTSIGGDAYKIYKLGEMISSKTNAFTATFLERFIGMFALVIISLYGYLSFSGVEIYSFLFVFILGLVSFFLFLLFYPKFQLRPQKLIKFFEILDKVHTSFMRYRNNKKIIFYSFLSSLIIQFSSIFSQYFVFKSLEIEIPLNFAFFSFPLIFLSGYAIPSVNSLGSQEVLYSSFFSSLGIASATIISASFLYHLVRLFVSLIGAYFYVNDKEYIKK
jgi:uncharacterized protein (TIRG00374 family)